ncbi:MAG: phenylalanine--tRNA ligase subunit alpha [bacterium]|nr:phenylalanine--tRNA ligase subunit alpha [bacterium]
MGLKEFIIIIETLTSAAKNDAKNVADADALERWRIKYLGKKSELTGLSRGLGQLNSADKPAAGKAINEAKNGLNALFAEIEAAAKSSKTESPAVDVTLPGRPPTLGGRHPITIANGLITEYFIRSGYNIWYGPDVEDDFHNFGALNFPADHPSRDTQDTFYLDGGLLMRTHTSPVQIRAMREIEPPFKLIVPGRCYRSDAVDASHYPIFHQVEGLVVGENISLGDLKGTLEGFAEYVFGAGTAMRFRPHFFPFTEPSAEVDFSCPRCDGKGCSACSNSGWLELLGSGMVDPNVFEAVGYDSEKWTGFAFGMGVERVAMIKYGITDIRMLYENDLRFLRQFG